MRDNGREVFLAALGGTKVSSRESDHGFFFGRTSPLLQAKSLASSLSCDQRFQAAVLVVVDGHEHKLDLSIRLKVQVPPQVL
jgi:hypothetical protein